MATRGSCSFTSPAEYRSALGDTPSLVAAEPEPFHARLAFADLPSLRLLRAEEGGPCVAFTVLPPARAFVTFPIHRQPPLIHNGVALRRGDMLFHAAEERFHQRTVSLTRWGRLSLRTQALAAFSLALAGQSLAPPPHGLRLRPAPADLAHLLRLHAQAARMAQNDPGRIGHPQIARALDQDIAAALVACLTQVDVRGPPAYRPEQSAAMDRFEQLLRADRSHAMPIGEMCERIGVSVQALAACCQDYLGMAPDQYRRLRRGAPA
jgi:hypothetical protein